MNQVSVEISLYPLRDEFVAPIADFIDRLNRHSSLTVRTNCMSTQVFGPYDEVLTILAAEMAHTHAEVPKAPFVLKVLAGNLLEGVAADA
ncbi:MAG: YkoF family thiamine/hydroxymethylpyrimidine-binding protein [Pseudomonadota bacterium]